MKSLLERQKRLEAFGSCVVEPVGAKTSFGIGGTALCFYPASPMALRASLPVLGEAPFAVLGGMSNVLCSSGEMATTLVFLRGEEFECIRHDDDRWVIGAGVRVPAIINACLREGRGGFEFAVGLPACVGGLTAMNATFRGEGIASILTGVSVLTREGEFCDIAAEELSAEYRRGGLGSRIVVSVSCRLPERSADESRKIMDEYIAFRRQKQAWGERSAGCVFKNPRPDLPAGKVIDECGLKGASVGGAAVSQRHANFIVNTGGATSQDVESLIAKVRQTVKEKTGVVLEEEVIRVI